MSGFFSKKRSDRVVPGPSYPGSKGKAESGSQVVEPSVSVVVDDAARIITRNTENLTPLGRTEPTACLFPNSESRSDSKSGAGCEASDLSSPNDSTVGCCDRPTTVAAVGGEVELVAGLCESYTPHGQKPTLVEDHQSVGMSSSLPMSNTTSITSSGEGGLRVNLPSSSDLPKQSCDGNTDIASIIGEVPARALNVATRTRLSLMLNPHKPLCNDWTSLAGEMGFEYESIENFERERDPMKAVLSAWTCRGDSTVGALMQMLADIERGDVLNDIKKLVERDVSQWMKNRGGDVHGQPVQVPEVSGSYPYVPETPELRGITLEDHPSGPPEIFDAYVCFTYADSEFVKEMMSVLEGDPYNLKLCIDFRDLVPGGSYSTVTAELIENRCKRMIIVLSPDFLASEDCNFQTKFAHSIAPSARSKRLIPVMVETCQLPNILRHLTICDYTKRDLRQWFWQRLHGALTKK